MKKRYQLTLTAETVEEFQATAKEMGLPSSFMSQVCDETIDSMLKMLKRVQAQGKFSITDLFTMLGEHIQEATDESQKAYK